MKDLMIATSFLTINIRIYHWNLKHLYSKMILYRFRDLISPPIVSFDGISPFGGNFNWYFCNILVPSNKTTPWLLSPLVETIATVFSSTQIDNNWISRTEKWEKREKQQFCYQKEQCSWVLEWIILLLIIYLL